MKVQNYKLLKKVIYKNSQLNLNKKNNMQILNLNKLNRKNLKFFNMRFFKENKYTLKFFKIKKRIKIKKKKKKLNKILFGLFWDDILNFLKNNESLILNFIKHNNLNIKSKYILFDFIIKSYSRSGCSKVFLLNLIKKKKNLKNYNKFKLISFYLSSLFNYKLMRKQVINYFFFFFNKYLKFKNFNFFSILDFIFSNYNKLNVLNLKLNFLKINFNIKYFVSSNNLRKKKLVI